MGKTGDGRNEIAPPKKKEKENEDEVTFPRICLLIFLNLVCHKASVGYMQYTVVSIMTILVSWFEKSQPVDGKFFSPEVDWALPGY